MSRRTQRKSATAGGAAASNSMAHRHLHLGDKLAEGRIRLGGEGPAADPVDVVGCACEPYRKPPTALRARGLGAAGSIGGG